MVITVFMCSDNLLKIRLFKFPQMDFEMAVWEMTHLLIAPKKVFKSIYYHKRKSVSFEEELRV